MCEKLFKIIRKQGVKCHFGSTPGFVFQGITFTIRALLQLRHNCNIPTWVALSDLFKVFDTSNNALIIAIPEKYGVPTKLYSTIEHICNKSVVKLVIRKIDTSIDIKVGVKK